MIGIVDGCKTRQTYENWLEEYALAYKIVTSSEEAVGCELIIFCGGPDIGENVERDRLDAAIWEKCKEKKIPILGICRGMQEICHFMGAELIEDLGVWNAIHKKTKEGTSNFHPVYLSDGRQWRVNSRHHQAVKNVPFKCSLTGKSPEGIWELLLAADDSKLLVQSHPEMKEMRGTEIEQACMSFIKRKLK